MSAQASLPGIARPSEQAEPTKAINRLAEYFTGEQYRKMAALAHAEGAYANAALYETASAYLAMRMSLRLFGNVGHAEAAKVLRKTFASNPSVDPASLGAQWKALQRDIHDTALAHGWWENPQPLVTQLALVHCEVSEAIEADRAGNPVSSKIPAFTSVEEELADIVIRVLDLAEARGFRLVEAIQAKMAFNNDRPYKHGGKRY